MFLVLSTVDEALVSDHLGNSKKWSELARKRLHDQKTTEVVAYKSFRNSLIIHKEKKKRLMFNWSVFKSDITPISLSTNYSRTSLCDHSSKTPNLS